ncbi:MAG: MATE family efflux transporter [Gammaproteobacteria bacterium]|nr:MATE family efflux transporter [Gammaproteobacteria bacterium]
MLQYLSDKNVHRQTFALAIPMILSNLTVPITGLVDTAVVGHLQQPYYLGATAVGSLIITMLMWIMGFLRMSTTGLAAQATGRDDDFQQRQVLFNGVITALSLSLVILLLQDLVWYLATVFMQASQEVLDYARQYFDIRIWSLPALLLRYVFIGWLLGLQKARWPLIILLISNLVNIYLDIQFVVWMDWKVEGAAWASVIADYAGLLVGIIAVWICLKSIPSTKKKPLFERSAIAKLIRMNRDIFIRTLALETVFYSQTAVGASMGDIVLAANAVLMNFVLIMSYGLDGFANAVEAMAGNAFGKRSQTAFKKAICVTGFWSLISSVMFMIIFGLLGSQIIHIMTGLKDVQAIALMYLPYLVMLPLIGVWSYWLDGIFIGITQLSSMRDSMLVAVILVFLPLLFTVKLWGNHGIWIAFSGFMIMRAAGLAYYLQRYLKRTWI